MRRPRAPSRPRVPRGPRSPRRPRSPISGRLGLITAPGLLVYVLITYLISNVLRLDGVRLWAFRLVLWLLGLVAFGLIFWFFKRSSQAKAVEEGPEGDGDLDAAMAAAKEQLAASPATATAALGKLPMVIVLGPEGSAKTSTIVHSGLATDLLAGAVYHGDRIAPTGCVNLWYSHNTVFLEAGGGFTAEPSRWSRLTRYIRPQTLGAVFSGRPQAPRVAIVCLSCEELLRPDSATAVPATAQELRSILVELAHGFGTQLPVYVIFTKADRIPYFAEYVANLTREETQEVLGATLRWPASGTTSAAEREFQRISEAFERLFASMAEKRLQLLPRETGADRKAAAYEFPREFRKVEPLATQFLLDLCRPSQLRISPVLRGFYFTGVRAVVVSEAAPEVAPRAATPESERIAATQVFDPRQQQAAMEQTPTAGPGSRRIPQWLFLERLFRQVILRDRMAMGVTQTGARLTMLRRLLMAGAVAVSFLLGSCFTTSYIGNQAMERRVRVAAVQIARVPELEPELLDLGALQAMDELRVEVEQLGEWEREGPPLRLRWGLYKGSALYPLVRELYHGKFESLVLKPARRSLLDSLQRLPVSPEERSEYQPNYNLLKAYLMTTGACEIDSTFLAPVLWNRWLGDRPADLEGSDIARRQFDFYAGKLCLGEGDPCVAESDPRVVRRARNFLRQFGGRDRNYQLMLSNASRSNPPIRFTDPDRVIVNRYQVPGAFTTGGWLTVHEDLERIDEILLAEDCVVPPQGDEGQNIAELKEWLRTRYVADYVRHWQAFLDSATVVSFRSNRDAAGKLETLSGQQSPLLQLLHIAAMNTVVDSVSVAPAFQPVRVVTPAEETETLYGGDNAGYMDALMGLWSSARAVEEGQLGRKYELVSQAYGSASKAETAVLQLTRKFSGAKEAEAAARAVEDFLMQPIERARRMVRGTTARDLNAIGADFCRQYQPVVNKYPFNPNATTQATLEEVATIFQPGTGALWQFYDQWLQGILVKQGPRYAAASGASPRPRSEFVTFFNNAARVTDALWSEDGEEPRFSFSLRARPTELIPSVEFTIDGRAYDFTRVRIYTPVMEWAGPRAGSAVVSGEMRGRSLNLLRYTGTWALFKLFGDASWQTTGIKHTVRWTFSPQGEAMSLEAEIDFAGAEPVLMPNYFGGARSCVRSIAR